MSRTERHMSRDFTTTSVRIREMNQIEFGDCLVKKNSKICPDASWKPSSPNGLAIKLKQITKPIPTINFEKPPNLEKELSIVLIFSKLCDFCVFSSF